MFLWGVHYLVKNRFCLNLSLWYIISTIFNRFLYSSGRIIWHISLMFFFTNVHFYWNAHFNLFTLWRRKTDSGEVARNFLFLSNSSDSPSQCRFPKTTSEIHINAMLGDVRWIIWFIFMTCLSFTIFSGALL